MARTTSTVERLLRVSEVADRLSVSDRTVRRWIQQGTLKPARLGDHTIRIEPAELERFLDKSRKARR